MNVRIDNLESLVLSGYGLFQSDEKRYVKMRNNEPEDFLGIFLQRHKKLKHIVLAGGNIEWKYKGFQDLMTCMRRDLKKLELLELHFWEHPKIPLLLAIAFQSESSI